MKTVEALLSDLYQQDVQLWLEYGDGDSADNGGSNGGSNGDAISLAKLRCNAPEEVLTDELTVTLRDRKAEIIAFLHRAAKAASATAAPNIVPVDRSQPIPLSFAQQRLWFLEQLQPGTATYNIPSAVRLKGTLDLESLTASFNDLLRRHESLRTGVQLVDGQPSQVIAPADLTLDIPVIDVTEADIRDRAVTEAQTPFDIAEAPLLRVTLLKLDEQDHVMLFTMHHLVSDGWSMEVLIRELVALYRGHQSGQPANLPDLPVQYADVSVWQRQWLQGDVLDEQLDYWKQQLGGTDGGGKPDLPVLQLPTDRGRSRIQGFKAGVETFELGSEVSDRLKSFATASGATLFMALLAAFNILLHRYTGQSDIVVGSPIANRNRKEFEGLIGFFVNTLVLRTDLSGNPSFKEVLSQVRQTTWDAYDHQDLPFEKLVEALHPERDLSYNPLFQVKFRLEQPPAEKFEVPDLTLEVLKQATSTAKLDLSVDLYDTPNGIVGGFEYNQDLFNPDTIQRMVSHFCILLESIVEQPDIPVGLLPLLTPTERQQVLEDWNQTQIGYAADQCFHQVFEERVKETPEAIALLYQDDSLTYDQFNRHSNQLAHHLQSLGVGPEVKVAICIDRSFEMMIAVMAVLKAGGAYVPLDPAYPAPRLEFMMEDSQAEILLVTSDSPDLKAEGRRQKAEGQPTPNPSQEGDRTSSTPQLPNSPTPQLPKIVNLTADADAIAAHSDTNPTSSVTPANLAYQIYTSGSTGTPKGVLVPHAGLVNLTEHKIRACDVHPDSCVLQFFSLSFDASIPELVMSLGCGAKLCLAPRGSLIPGPELLALLRRHQVTHITITPSALAVLPVTELPDLKMVLVGGEAPSPDLIEQWSENRRFINAYGPTEVTVNASMVQCGNGHPISPTIAPSANKQLYVLDASLQPVPIGVLGELHIGGVGLARGYFNRPDKTADVFVPNPFVEKAEGRRQKAEPTPSPSEEGDRSVQNPKSKIQNSLALYKTGDLAAYLPDGRIKLLGRIDQQVKIRGFRIEPGEIEAVLADQETVQACVVIVREDNPGDKRLAAYVVLESDGAQVQDGKDLRRLLKTKLPEYMVPSDVVVLDQLPLTPNGKVDTEALPVPDRSSNQSADTILAPRSDTEKVLAEIFSTLLEVEPIGIQDDFFELGGHSLLATQLVAQSLDRFGIELTVADLFEAPTVIGLAERIEQHQTIQQLQAALPDELDDDDREEMEF
ncbi:MAG: amino acid adenylation domain-containing protein [Cyanobacteria bacterium P01_F01_bin.150]